MYLLSKAGVMGVGMIGYPRVVEGRFRDCKMASRTWSQERLNIVGLRYGDMEGGDTSLDALAMCV